MTYRGRQVVVTGASSGIGQEAARSFAARGATVIAVARREDRLERLVQELRVHAPDSRYLAGDLGEREFAESIVREATLEGRRLDILVNNAGMPMHTQIYDLAAEQAERVMAVNFLSCVWTTLAALPAMVRAGGGTIVNVSSFAALVTPPREAIYAASKAAMNSFTEGLWHDLAGSNVHAGIVNPGPIDTEIWEIGDEASSYRGRLYPPSIVVDAIFEVIERKRFEVTVPRRHAGLVAARALRLYVPGLLRWAMARFERVPPSILDRVRDGNGDGG
ncbi:MAG: SDR family NAD(P)-dependent oxidoreductase [Myxococcota bacterium]